MFYISFFHAKYLKSNMSFLFTAYLNLHQPHFKYTSTFQVLNSYLWLVVATLDSLVLDQQFSRRGTQTSSIDNTRELLEVQILGPHFKPTESDPVGLGNTNLHFNKSLLVILKNAKV